MYTVILRDDKTDRVIRVEQRWLAGCQQIAVAYGMSGRVIDEAGTCGWVKADGTFRPAGHR